MSAHKGTLSGSFLLARRGVVIASALLPALAGTELGAPVLITAPKTVGPLDTMITPTAGGAAVALSDAEITVSGTTLTINGRHTIASLALENSAVLRHSTNTIFDYPGTGIIRGTDLTVLGNATINAIDHDRPHQPRTLPPDGHSTARESWTGSKLNCSKSKG